MERRPVTQHSPEEATVAMVAYLSDPAVRRGESDPFEIIAMSPMHDARRAVDQPEQQRTGGWR
jgi:hypothetical protein